MEPIELLWIEDVRRELRGQSDRGLAIVGAAILDEFLKMLLRDFMVSDKALDKRLFEGEGPLATFSARIQLCHGLGLISRTEYRLLDIIRRIRNDFAHQLGDVSFTKPLIRDRCALLSIPVHLYVPDRNIPLLADGSVPEVDLTPPDASQPRELFAEAVFHVMMRVGARWVMARANKRVPPDDFETATQPLRMIMAHYDDLSDRASRLRAELGRLQESAGAIGPKGGKHQLGELELMMVRLRPSIYEGLDVIDELHRRQHGTSAARESTTSPLTNAEADELVSTLRPFAGASIIFLTDHQPRPRLMFVNQVASLFQKAGWQTAQLLVRLPECHNILGVRDAQAPGPAAEAILQSFTRLGIDLNVSEFELSSSGESGVGSTYQYSLELGIRTQGATSIGAA